MASFFSKFKKTMTTGLNRFTATLKFAMLSVVAATFNFKNPRVEKYRQNAKNQMMGRKTAKKQSKDTGVEITQEDLDKIYEQSLIHGKTPTPEATVQPKAPSKPPKETELEAKARKAAKAEARMASRKQTKQMKKKLKKENPGMSGKKAARMAHTQKMKKAQSSGYSR